MIQEKEVQFDFAHMDIPTVEKLVGRKADDVRVENKFIVCTFKGMLGEGVCSAHTEVRFKKW